ncbi:MAG: hypothetical protein ACR2PR_02475 [Pseudohongiellaceae bacterium]
MSLINKLKASKYESCVIHECSPEGCTKVFHRDRAPLRLKGSPAPHILIDCDKSPIKQDEKRCDYIFVADGKPNTEGYALPIEMTSGYKDASDAQAQLQAGTKTVSKIVPQSAKLTFVPVFVGKLKEMKRRKWKDLRKEYRIKFRGDKFDMKILGKEENLANALR